jgi:acyl-homoserine-lactone acylase
MKRIAQLLLFVSLYFPCLLSTGQTFDPSKIDIVRDKWGVPHIFANTDAEVAYGLAYAHAEDDFNTIQTSFMAGKAMLGRYKGKEGATVDYTVHLLRIRELVDSKYETDISVHYKTVLEGYCAGINAYAKTHKSEVLLNALFPMTPKDMLCYSVLQLCVLSGADGALKSIYGGTVPTIELEKLKPVGSNAYAFNSNKTVDGQTYLNINAHQPLEGPVSWYEAHLHSNEGWNILGALFAGAPSILLGCNENLAWAHTVNYPDKVDVYQLQVNPANKLQYKFDGNWETLEETNAKLKVKVAGLGIGVNKKTYWSKYGPTVITDRGTFSIRLPALFDIRGLEQWFWMNKARNFTEFKNALKMEAIPGYNVMYADRFDTIYYLSNAKLPFRTKGYKWRSTLPGNTSATLWTKLHHIEDLPQMLNPSSGYLFNSNHSVFHATDSKDYKPLQNVDETMGYEKDENNRSIRFAQLISKHDKITYEDFKKIKFDLQYPTQIVFSTKTDSLFMLKANDYPAIADVINILNNWNHVADVNNEGATIFGVMFYYITSSRALRANYQNLTKEKSVELLTYARDYLLKNFGKVNVPLGTYQRLVRGEKSLPLAGLPDVIASMESVPYKNGQVRGLQGESYIELVRFTKEGPQIESIHSYGASSKKDSPHYADQMENFTAQKTKRMTLNKEEIYKEAERVYHPK